MISFVLAGVGIALGGRVYLYLTEHWALEKLVRLTDGREAEQWTGEFLRMARHHWMLGAFMGTAVGALVLGATGGLVAASLTGVGIATAYYWWWGAREARRRGWFWVGRKEVTIMAASLLGAVALFWAGTEAGSVWPGFFFVGIGAGVLVLGGGLYVASQSSIAIRDDRNSR
jgi:hypothetical protein